MLINCGPRAFQRLWWMICLQVYPAPQLHYIILLESFDWDIDDITVINNFDNHHELMLRAQELNIEKLTHHLLVEEWSTTKSWVNNR